MTPLTTVHSNGSVTQRNKRSIISKVGSILGSKSSHINAFSIELDESLKQHNPGETVKGKVVLNVGKPLGVTHVVASLYGYVQVFKNHSKPSVPTRGNSTRVATGQNKRWVSEYYGDGFASLFEEEVVLCGEGRLDPKLYHFRFEIDFPSDLALPSSIDFERGTITYMVSATITRPSTIGTTTSCERKVLFREDIDIGRLAPPKPREVTLRALDQGSRPKPHLKRLTSYEKKRSSHSLAIARTNQSIRTLDDTSSHFSPSVASSRSSSSSRDPVASLASDLRSSQHSRSPKRSGSDVEDKRKSIFVVVEPSKSGCIAGEVLSIAIQVQHSKIIQSANGVIATLYRQARVDMHPNLPISSNVRSRDGRFEDYYPRSKTGLGGLSLSAAGSSQVWRKDLSQSFAPFYIDPRTMSTDVKIAVRIPDDAFPSIRSVPGEMISFRYYVEVIIDIHGKLGPTEMAPSTPTLQSSLPSTPRGQSNEGPDYVSKLIENYVDTSTIRREKNALVVECDLTIGTRDSTERSRGKQRATSNDREWIDSGVHEIPLEAPFAGDGMEERMDNGYHYNNSEWYGYGNGNYYHGADEYGNDYDYTYDEQYSNQGYDGYEYAYPAHDGQYSYPNGQYIVTTVAQTPRPYPGVPIPPLEDESAVSEKEQLRRAEARLLPSQPPLEGESAFMAEQDAPTAPMLPEEGYYEPPRSPALQSMHIPRPETPRQVSQATIINEAVASTTDMEPIDRSGMVEPVYHRTEEPPSHTTDEQEEPRRPHLPEPASAPRADEVEREERSSAPWADEAEEAAILGVDHEQGRVIEELTAAGEALPRYER